MAVRNVASTPISGAAGTVTYPPPQAGDKTLAFVSGDNNGFTTTMPAGWTSRGNASISSPDGLRIFIYEHDGACTGSETDFAVTFTGTSNGIFTLINFTGRDTSAASSLTFVGAATTNTTANAPSFAVNGSGGSAAVGDDVVFIVSFDPTAAGPTLYTLSSVTSGFSIVDEASANWTSHAAWCDENYASTGTVNVSATANDGATTAGWISYVLGVKAAPSTGATLFNGSTLLTTGNQLLDGSELICQSALTPRTPRLQVRGHESARQRLPHRPQRSPQDHSVPRVLEALRRGDLRARHGLDRWQRRGDSRIWSSR